MITPHDHDTDTPLTVDIATQNAARLLYHAEREINIPLMEQLVSMSDSWLHMASILMQQDS